jgi:hypothetical protein
LNRPPKSVRRKSVEGQRILTRTPFDKLRMCGSDQVKTPQQRHLVFAKPGSMASLYI